MRVEKVLGQGHAGGVARGAAGAVRGRLRRHQPLSAARPSEAAAQHPRRQGGEPERQVRRAGFFEERQHRGRRRAADVPGHRHRIIMGKKGCNVITDGEDEAALSEGARDAYLRRNLRYSQVAPLSMYEEKNTANNMPAQCEIYAEGGSETPTSSCSWPRAAAVRQQEFPVPGDAVGADERSPARVPEGEGAHARHRGVPALSSGDRDRRHLGRALHEDGEARVRALSRRAADPRLGRRQRLPRRRDGAGNPQDDAVARRRRAVRRQIFLPRRARDPHAAPRRIAPHRARRVLLGRPPGARQDHQGRRLSSRSSSTTPRNICRRSSRRSAARWSRSTSTSR